MKIYYLFILILIICQLLCDQTTNTFNKIDLSQAIKLNIQLGQHNQKQLVQYFDFYQSTSLSNLIHQNNQLNQNQISNCQIHTKNQHTFKTKNIIYHYGLSQSQQYSSGNTKIYNFSDLKKLIGVLDMIYYKNEIIILFESGYYSFYQFNQQDDNLTLIKTNRLQSNILNYTKYDKLSYSQSVINYWGDLIKSQDQQNLIFIGQQKVFLLNKINKQFQQVKNYIPKLGIGFQKAIIVDNEIICASTQLDYQKLTLKWKQGFKPVIHLYYGSSYINNMTNQINQINSTTINQVNQTTQNQINQNISTNNKYSIITQLRPTDIGYDRKRQSLIIVDDINGINWIKIPQYEQSIVTCENKSILIQKCQNLMIIQNSNIIIATCPQLIIINLQTRQHKILNKINFNPTSIQINQSKIYLFGYKQYAIYDIDTQSIQFGITDHQIQYSLILNHSIITVNRFSINTIQILFNKQVIYCDFNQQYDHHFIGDNQLSITYQGHCSNLINYNHQISQFLNSNPQIKNYTQICQINQILLIQVIDSSKPKHYLQFIISSIIILILIIGIINYYRKNKNINLQYQQIIEQANHVHMDDKMVSAVLFDPHGKHDFHNNL